MMNNYVGIKKNSGYILYVGLGSQAAATILLQVNPTIAAGDFKVSIDGGAFNNLGTLPAVTPAGGRAVKITLSAAEMNGDNITLMCVDAAGAEWCDLAINIQTTPVDASIVQIDGTANSSATFNLKKLNIVNSAGDAIVASSTGSNGTGIAATGNGSGHGIAGTGGVTGIGIVGAGGATSGQGISALANGGNSSGFVATGNGSGHGIHGIGGATGGNGFHGVGGATTGSGAFFTAATSGYGIAAVGAGNSDGMAALGSGTGNGLLARGGVTSANGISAEASGGNGVGLNVFGFGSGSGVVATGGATGQGIAAIGGITSGSGLYAYATTSGAGIQAAGAGGGNGIHGLGNGIGTGIVGTGGATGHGIAGVGGAASGHGLLGLAVGSGAGADFVGVGSVSIIATQGISGPLDASERDAIATALLKLNLVGITGEAAYSLLNAIRYLRNWSISGSTLTIYKEDGTTPAWTSTLTTSSAADLVTAFDTN